MAIVGTPEPAQRMELLADQQAGSHLIGRAGTLWMVRGSAVDSVLQKILPHCAAAFGISLRL
jgi:hypothetical protein